MKTRLFMRFWDHEEVGLIGAKNYTNKGYNGDGIIAVLNMDMMAYEMTEIIDLVLIEILLTPIKLGTT
ncbi:MAG: M28 family peptidase [Chitinophagales bacterium]